MEVARHSYHKEPIYLNLKGLHAWDVLEQLSDSVSKISKKNEKLLSLWTHRKKFMLEWSTHITSIPDLAFDNCNNIFDNWSGRSTYACQIMSIDTFTTNFVLLYLNSMSLYTVIVVWDILRLLRCFSLTH